MLRTFFTLICFAIQLGLSQKLGGSGEIVDKSDKSVWLTDEQSSESLPLAEMEKVLTRFRGYKDPSSSSISMEKSEANARRAVMRKNMVSFIPESLENLRTVEEFTFRPNNRSKSSEESAATSASKQQLLSKLRKARLRNRTKNKRGDSCTCARAKPAPVEEKATQNRGGNNRIVNGYAVEERRPWISLLLIGGLKAQCGGSLINHKYVLTAAHCLCMNNTIESFLCEKVDVLDSKRVSPLVRVFVGPHSMTKIYMPYAGPYDLALVRLDTWIEFIPNKIAPICLSQAERHSASVGYVAGFGSSTYKDACWTSLDGPNAFMECAYSFRTPDGNSVKGKCASSEVPMPKVCYDLLETIDESKLPERVYLQEGKTRILCPHLDTGRKQGWCQVKSVDMTENPSVTWGLCSNHCYNFTGSSEILTEVKLDIMEREECRQLGRESRVEMETEFCAASRNTEYIHYTVYEKKGSQFKRLSSGKDKLEFFGGKDACQGDSGGPIWTWSGDPNQGGLVTAEQVGIVSRGQGCAYKNQPGIFTSLHLYIDFIREKSKDGGCSSFIRV